MSLRARLSSLDSFRNNNISSSLLLLGSTNYSCGGNAVKHSSSSAAAASCMRTNLPLFSCFMVLVQPSLPLSLPHSLPPHLPPPPHPCNAVSGHMMHHTHGRHDGRSGAPPLHTLTQIPVIKVRKASTRYLSFSPLTFPLIRCFTQSSWNVPVPSGP